MEYYGIYPIDSYQADKVGTPIKYYKEFPIPLNTPQKKGE